MASREKTAWNTENRRRLSRPAAILSDGQGIQVVSRYTRYTGKVALMGIDFPLAARNMLRTA